MKATVKDLTFEIRAIVEEDGAEYHGFCPDLKGLHVFGATIEDTLKDIAEAAVLYIESLMELGDPIPVGVD